MRIKAFVLVLALLGAAGFFVLRSERKTTPPAAPTAAGAAPGVSAPNSFAPAPEPPALPADPSLRAEVETFRAAEPVKRVEKFYAAESRRVGEIDKDPDLTARRLAAVAAELKGGEIDWLKNAALDPKRPGDGRFFAAYLLALNPGPATTAALRQVAMSPVPNGRTPGFTELERQVRGQATEGLGHARGQAEAQDALLDVIAEQQDEFIRDRAHRALYEWRTGKRVETQDEEALRKVTGGGK